MFSTYVRRINCIFHSFSRGYTKQEAIFPSNEEIGKFMTRIHTCSIKEIDYTFHRFLRHKPIYYACLNSFVDSRDVKRLDKLLFLSSQMWASDSFPLFSLSDTLPPLCKTLHFRVMDMLLEDKSRNLGELSFLEFLGRSDMDVLLTYFRTKRDHYYIEEEQESLKAQEEGDDELKNRKGASMFSEMVKLLGRVLHLTSSRISIYPFISKVHLFITLIFILRLILRLIFCSSLFPPFCCCSCGLLG